MRRTLIDRPSVVGLPPATVSAGFRIGLFARSDVAEWVGHRSAKLTTIPEELLRLVPIHDLDDATIGAALDSLAGPIDAGERARLGVDALCMLHRMGVLDARTFAAHLDSVIAWNLDVLPGDLTSLGYTLDDEFAMAEGGYGDLERAEAGVTEFVEKFGRDLG